jgi:diketogulonate reductase-like aldo/keto reductase
MEKRSAMQCRPCSGRGRFGDRTSSSPQNFGTPIIVLSGSSLPFDASRRRLQIDYVDFYIIHTPFAFKPGNEQDPRDERGQGDAGRYVASARRSRGRGQCRSIGLSDVNLEIVAAVRIKPALVQVESHPYLPEWELLDFCREHGIVLLAFCGVGTGV